MAKNPVRLEIFLDFRFSMLLVNCFAMVLFNFGFVKTNSNFRLQQIAFCTVLRIFWPYNKNR
jgi:hypothetical protein